MNRHFKVSSSVPTELSWQEKYPTSYVYRPSEAIQWLENQRERKKASNRTGDTSDSAHSANDNGSRAGE